MAPDQKPFRILALSGGGCFCHGQTLVLSRVLDKLSKFDLVCGTSGGAINAAIAFNRYLPIGFEDFYRKYASRIFKGRSWRKFNPGFARYPDSEFNAILMRHAPGRFDDLKVPMYAISHDISAGKAKVWFSRDGQDGDWPVWEVARASSSAHSYFPPWRGYGDGGVFANDPVMCGIAGAVANFGVRPRDIRVFSLGTGAPEVKNRLGLPKTRLGWASVLLQDTLTSVSMARYQARSLLENSYQHYDLGARRGMDFDDPAVVEMIDKHWKDTVEHAGDALELFLS